MDRKMIVPEPPALDAARLSDPAYTIRGESSSGSVLVHFDPTRASGGVCFLAGEVWAIWGPMQFGEFVAALGNRGIRIVDGKELARWVLACTSAPGAATH